MESPFLYKLPSGTKIFRATTLNKEGRWYTLSLEDAYAYGEIITEYSTTIDLNLINIMSLTFHNDYIDRLNIMFPGINYSGFDVNKLGCLIPLGLLDLDTQKEAMNFLEINKKIENNTWNNMLEFLNKCMMNRHRFSEHSLDTYFVTVLEKIYGNHYDGYISPFKWPTKIHGHLFPRELCTFIQGNVIEVATHNRPLQAGGEKKMPIEKIHINIEHFRKIEKEFIESCKKYKFEPLWNPHTEDDNKSDLFNINKKNKNTKTRKNKHNIR